MNYIDYFNNTSNNFVDPGFKNCYGSNDTTSNLVFEDSKANIINNGDVLSSLNLEDIKFPLTQYIQETKYINPDSYIILGDLTKGLAYRQQYFQLPNYNNSSLSFNIKLKFQISYFKNFTWITDSYTIEPNSKTHTSLTDTINNIFTENNINASSKLSGDYLVFEGKTEGFSFNVFNMQLAVLGLDEWFDIEEDVSKAVDSIKYINGACKGIVMKITYPKYNNENIEDIDKYIYYKSIPDTIDIYSPFEFDPSCNIDASCYDPSTMQLYTKQTYELIINGACGDNIMSLNEYMSKLTKENLWNTTGVFFANLSTENDKNSNLKTLIPSMIFYNPHYFPVKIDYLIVA